MGRLNRSLLLVVPTLLALNTAYADLAETVKTYNSGYQAVLENNTTWKQQLAAAQQEVEIARQAYEEALEKTAPARDYYEHILFETEKLRGAVKVWQNMSPLAQAVQQDVAVEAAAGEKDFNSPEEVNLASLISKASELQGLIDQKDSEIADEDAKILGIKLSPEYIAVDSALTSARETLLQAERALESLQTQASLLDDQLSTQEWELSESEDRVLTARSRITNIEIVEIPGKEDEIRQAERDKTNLVQNELRPLRARLQKLRNEQIPNKRAEVRATQLLIDELPEGTPELVKQELIDRKAKQEQRLSTLERELDRGVVTRDRLIEARDQFDQDVLDLEDEIARLRIEITTQRQVVADELIYQGQLDDLIADIKSSQSQNELAQISANSSITAALSSVDIAASAYAAFDAANIDPIEAVIARLNRIKSGFVTRRTNVNSWKDRIIRQDNNLQEIAENMAQRLEELQVMEADLAVAKNTMDVAMKAIGETMSQANAKITAYNELAGPIREQVEKFRDAEKQILESMNQ